MVHYIELPAVDEKVFFMNKEVVIVKIFKNFNLAKVKFLDSSTIFSVDIHALSKEPDMTNTISIGILSGGNR